MKDSQTLLTEIKSKIRSMRNDRSSLENEYAKMSERLQKMQDEIDLRNNKIGALEKELEVMGMAKSMGEDGMGNREARHKINEMVKEIDRCIAMLNS